MKKLILLAIMAAVTAMMAIPAIASAGEWDIDSENEKLPLAFTSAGGAAQLKSGFGAITCTANTGSGSYETKTTGTLTQTFTGCKDPFGGNCQSGATAGTIVTFVLPFHNIMLEATGSPAPYTNGTPGVLITPNAVTGDFATFTCNVIGAVTVKGNGLVGDISNPGCGGAFQKTATLSFEESAAGGNKQKWTQNTTAGTIYDLSSVTFAGTQTSAQVASGTVTYAQGTKITCP